MCSCIGIIVLRIEAPRPRRNRAARGRCRSHRIADDPHESVRARRQTPGPGRAPPGTRPDSPPMHPPAARKRHPSRPYQAAVAAAAPTALRCLPARSRCGDAAIWRADRPRRGPPAHHRSTHRICRVWRLQFGDWWLVYLRTFAGQSDASIAVHDPQGDFDLAAHALKIIQKFVRRMQKRFSQHVRVGTDRAEAQRQHGMISA